MAVVLLTGFAGLLQRAPESGTLTSMESTDPFCKIANKARNGTDKIVSVQESHKNGEVGNAAANPGSSYKPKPQGG